MNVENIIHFSISKTGASHLPQGKPCQDYSLSWESEDKNVKMAIVCDGHGSSTYVRSDVGARLAATITRDLLIKFVKDTNPTFFLNIKGSVTARPLIDDSLWGTIPVKPVDQMTEMEQLSLNQDRTFYSQVEDIREQDKIMVLLFQDIYNNWMEAINEDFQTHPFTENEKQLLGNNKIVKAYGTTLQAYIQTPYYWIAFHIGDGRLVTANRNMIWNQPVPWDCHCFQNMTTSLCNTEPVQSFRYAFDGTGKFPAAVICSSDGMEDSYGDYELAPQYLHKFYTGILNEFFVHGKDETMRKLDEFLPKLSAAGSKDDMSMAGVINLDAIGDGLKQYEILCKIEEINKEHDKRVKAENELSEQIGKAEKEMSQLNDENNKKHSWLNEIKNKIQRLYNEIKQLRDEENTNEEEIKRIYSDIKEKTKERDALKDKLTTLKKDNTEADNDARNRKFELQDEYDKIDQSVKKAAINEMEKWKIEIQKLT